MSKKKKHKKDSQQPAHGEAENIDAEAKEGQPELKVTDSIDDKEQQLGELQLKYQRLAADFQNYQKRSLKQIEQAGQFSKENLVKALLPALDNFEHALEKGADAQDPNAIIDGIKIVYDHLMDIFTSEGLKPIAVENGCPFNPNMHEALMQEESEELAPNSIVRELGRGYMMNDRAIRPAKVSVAKAPVLTQPEETTEEQTEESEKTD